MKNILVLMSTYNGEKYLDSQIETILSQIDVKVNLLVRDDGSTDDTIKILNKKKIEYIKGDNLKSAYSFLELIFKCNKDNDYYSLSDQDDFWLNNKLIEAIKLIQKEEKRNPDKPIIYFSSKNVVNGQLKFLYKLDENEDVTLGSAMIKNIATGCTMVFNKKMLEAIRKYKPVGIEMHDSWIYRLCLAIGGKAIYDNNSYILYRQHGQNVIGANETFIKRIKRRINSFKNNNRYRSKMAQELIKGYEKDISKENLEILKLFVDYKKSKKQRLKLMFNKKIRVKSLKDNAIFKIAVLLKKV